MILTQILKGAGSESLRENESATAVFAYLDDAIVAVPPEHAEAAFNAAIDVFSRAGQQVHPGKSACWSLATPREALPAECQRIWNAEGLLVGGIPVFDESQDPVLAERKLSKVLANVAREADLLVKLVRDDQVAADESWSRVQATLLILRYSLASKLIYFAQTINPAIVASFASEFDSIMRETYLKESGTLWWGSV